MYSTGLYSNDLVFKLDTDKPPELGEYYFYLNKEANSFFKEGDSKTYQFLMDNKFLTDKNLLSVWIEGNGLAARALLHHSHKQACYHCIRHYEQDGKLLAIKNNPGVILNGGCRTPYVTYPVMAAVEAANLGATMTLDWANDVLEPSFRTRLIDTSKELETFDCNPTPHPKCPVCNPST